MEKFTQKKNGQWMWSKEYRDTMRERLIWDTSPPDDIKDDDWIWAWSHNANIGPKSVGKYDGAKPDSVGMVFAVPVGDYVYPDKWWQSPLRMATFRYVVLTEDEKQFIQEHML